MYLAPAAAALQMKELLYNLKNIPKTLRTGIKHSPDERI
jgi:hypothetical protein